MTYVLQPATRAWYDMVSSGIPISPSMSSLDVCIHCFDKLGEAEAPNLTYITLTERALLGIVPNPTGSLSSACLLGPERQ